MAEETKSSKVAIKSDSFKIFTADTFGVRLSNHMAQIVFSIETVNETDQECHVLEATAALSLQSFKVLTLVLANALATVETDLGPIALGPGKEEELRKSFEAIIKKRQPPPDR